MAGVADVEAILLVEAKDPLVASAHCLGQTGISQTAEDSDVIVVEADG